MAKKKSQLKNPQRGFATTSIVKKKEPEPEPEATEGATLPSNAASTAASSTNNISNPQANTHISNGQSDIANGGTSWDDSEEAKEAEERLAFAERVKNASEKEAARALKTIEYEKRMSSSYPEFRWDDPVNLRDQIIQLALQEEDSKPILPVKDDEEKLVTKIATISIVLRKLGFDSAQIDQCLRKVRELELETALNWIYLHYEPSLKMNDESADSTYQHHGQGSWTEVHAAPIRKPVAQPSMPALSPARQPVLKVSSISVPSASKPPSATTASTTNGAEEASKVKDRPVGSSLLAYRDPNKESSDEDDPEDDQSQNKTSASSSSVAIQPNDDDDDMDPTGAYVAAKLRFTSLERKLGLASKQPGKKGGAKTKPKAGAAAVDAAEMQEYQRLDARLKEFQRDYLFNQKQADAIFAVERAKLDKQELAERLAGKAKERAAAACGQDGTALPSATASQQVSRAPSPTGKADGAEDSLFGDMLDDPQAAPAGITTEEAPETDSKGNIIKVRDMSLPKSYTGKTPKSLLEDALRRVDKSAKATYRLLSHTRAARAVVTIRWEGGRMQQFGMEDEACEIQEQAFHYAATLALFAISSDGNLHRLLPGPYRDLWDELEARKRTTLADIYAKEIVACKNIASFRAAQSIQDDTSRPINRSKEPPKAITQERNAFPSRRVNEDVLRADYEARASAPSYKAMLVRPQGIVSVRSADYLQQPVRQSLPIFAYRDTIISTIEQHQVVVLCGETGCGKSTQTPTMILEHALANGQHAKIFCTEPRRISAISLAQRVSQELGESLGSLGTNRSLVGYNIRLEARVSNATRLVYATTGIVLRMLEGDTELQEVTHVIIDEVHERSIDSDFLLIILKSLLARRKDLRVILMSATVDAEKIATYMGPTTPVIQVPGRTFPVTPYFLEDAVEISNYRLEMDSDSPYVDRQSRKRGKYQEDLSPDDDAEEDEHSQIRSGYSRQTQSTLKVMNEQLINFDLMLSLLETICFGNAEFQPYSKAILVFLPSLDTIRTLCDLLEGHPRFGSKDFQIYPLHSSISNEQQARVFEMPPAGVRKIVVSTNIAETGVTIPDITAVIDSGRHKEMRFDEKRQISKLVECWIAKSNALQRRGRAGRVQEGICFHMFTMARLDTSLAEHPIPEILRLSLQDLALRIKILKFSGSIDDVLQRALDPPLTANIQRAVSSLIDIKALTTTEEITQLGKHLVKLPLDVYTAKFCLLATLFGCLDAALTIAATLNSKSFFVTPFGREMEADTIKRSFRQADEHSDFLVMYRAYCLWRSNCENGTFFSFARKHFLSHVTLTQIEELKAQYMSNLVEAGFISSANTTSRYPKGPRVRFVQLEPHLSRYSGDSGVVMACIAASMHPKLLYKDAGNIWKTLTNNAPVAIHPSSSNFIHGRRPDFGNASFITYFNIQQSKKLYVWENGVVDEKAVLLLCGDVDVKHFAHSASLDRKIRRHVERKSGLAIDLLRSHFNQIWLSRLDAPSRPWSDQDLKWFQMLVQAISSTETEQLREQKRKEKPPVAINVVRQRTSSD